MYSLFTVYGDQNHHPTYGDWTHHPIYDEHSPYLHSVLMPPLIMKPMDWSSNSWLLFLGKSVNFRLDKCI